MDLAEAHVKSLQWLEKNKNVVEHFNIGQGKGNSVLEIIQLFEEVNQQKVDFAIAPRRNGDIAQIWANAQKADSILHWRTTRSTRTALSDAWRFYLHQSKK
jgi:UDP-glucose 4-epimerase